MSEWEEALQGLTDTLDNYAGFAACFSICLYVMLHMKYVLVQMW